MKGLAVAGLTFGGIAKLVFASALFYAFVLSAREPPLPAPPPVTPIETAFPTGWHLPDPGGEVRPCTAGTPRRPTRAPVDKCRPENEPCIMTRDGHRVPLSGIKWLPYGTDQAANPASLTLSLS